MAETEDYLQITPPELWSLNGFADWCISCERFENNKMKILDYIKKGLEKIIDNTTFEEDIRQKASDLREEFQSWKSSKTTTEYFQRVANRYQTEQQLELIENEKAIELAKMECIKVTQTRNHVESTMKVHHQITENIVEFSQKQNISSKNITLESEEKQDENRKRSGYDLHEEKSKRIKSNGSSRSATPRIYKNAEQETPIKLDLEKFEEEYLKMKPDHMWTLRSGRRVEEVIYEFARELEFESYLHSFIVNESDAHTKSLFSKEEWKEINTSEVDDRLELEYSLKELLKKYTVDDVEKLREILFEPFIPNGYKYDRKFHFDLDFVNRVYRGMLPLWEVNENPFDSLKLEGWYEMNIWSHLIDPAFYNVNIDLIRGEGMSLASSDRKNVERTTSDRKKVGRKGDGVFRLHKDRLEFGAIEAGRDWEGQCGSKIITDSLKICKMLKDMLNQLAIECNMKENHVRKLRVVGMLQSGNRMQVITADLSKGYVTRIRRRKVCEVSAHLTKSKPLALVLKEIFYVKNIILRTFDIINRKDDIDIETFLDNSDEEGYRTPPRKITSNTFVTPTTERTKDVVNGKICKKKD
ncbi:7163_t:CDS:2 [Gigaspora rosea]|nr:7163_t:CDS:2 [Gigaspora rosea]